MLEMSPEYRDTMKRLLGLKRLGIRPGLESTRALLRVLGDPQEGLAAVHIAGTNGKGSVAAMMDSVLMAAGYRTGLYTSPHLSVFNERIRVSGSVIPDGDLSRIAARVLEAAEVVRAGGGMEATFFEVATAMALLYFRQEGVEVALLETGMGGRLDATNVVRPLVSIITGVDMDHRAYLGGTIEDIATEKAGIIKEGVPVVSGALRREAARVIEKRSAELKNTPLLCPGSGFSFEAGPSGGLDYHGPELSLEGLEVGLYGAHQKGNAALAIAGLEVLMPRFTAIDGRAIREGLGRVTWPGRFEVIQEGPDVIIDCAHNPAGAEALAEAIRGRFSPQAAITLVLGISRDKDIPGILASLLPLARRVIFTEACPERAAPAALLLEAARGSGAERLSRPTVAGALEAALEACPKAGPWSWPARSSQPGRPWIFSRGRAGRMKKRAAAMRRRLPEAFQTSSRGPWEEPENPRGS